MNPDRLRTAESGGRKVWVEIVDPPEGTEVPAGMTWIRTRTLWATSLCGQIEQEGAVLDGRLSVPTAAELRKVVPLLERLDRRAKDTSQAMFEVLSGARGDAFAESGSVK